LSKQEVITQEMNKKSSKTTNSISRRDFIKLSGTVGAVAAFSDFSFGGPIKTLVEGTRPQATVQEDVWIPTACYACDRNCGLLVHRVNGVVVKVEGNPTNPDNKGRICTRANLSLDVMYNPWRVKAPMKRTNPERGRGVDPKWVEITWEEALSTVADKLKAVKADDPRKFVFFTGHRGANMRDPVSRRAFCPAFGTPNDGLYAGGGMFCSGFALHISSGLSFGAGNTTMATDRQLGRFNLSIGSGSENVAKATPASNREVIELKEKGTKFVAIDPYMGMSLSKMDRWIPIRPSSDLAFMLSFMNVIVNELKTYDADFLKNRSNAPYLIGPDGHYVRSKDQIVADPMRLKQQVGKPLMWDLVDQKAKTWDDETLTDPALEGTYTVDDVQARPAFQVMKDEYKNYTPEWAEKLTTVSAQTIRDLAKEFVDEAKIGSTTMVNGVTMPYRPVSVAGGRGAHNHQWGFDTHWAEPMINMLVGNYGVAGGVTGSEVGQDLLLNPADGVTYTTRKSYGAYTPIKVPPQRADVMELYPLAYKMHPQIWPAILNPKDYYLQYQPEVALLAGIGLFGGTTGLSTIEAGLKKFPFIAAVNIASDEADEFADIIMPDNSYMERYYVVSTSEYTPEAPNGPYRSDYDVLRQPVVEQPVFNSRDGNDIMMDLAESVGILYGKGGVNDRINGYLGLNDPYKLDLNKKYTWQQIVDLQLKNENGAQYGLDWFKKNGMGVQPIETFEVKDYFSVFQKARHLFYNDYYLWVGEQWASELKKYGVQLKPNNEFHTKALHALPAYNPDPQIAGDTAAPPEYDLWVTHAKTLLHSMTNPMSNAWIGEVTELFDPYSMNIVMNTQTARARGLKDGDSVVVESLFGKTTGQIKITELVGPELIGMHGCFGFKAVNMPAYAKAGPHINELGTMDEKYICPICTGFENRMRVKVYKV
jgi:anaerobic selenocysteine-containing dehydrogenase